MTPVVRPKTPRGDGNWIALTGLALILVVVRPKTPRGDGNRMDPGELQMVREVVRPKTPRGDGNSKSSTTSAAAACSRSRQTQNPERGRKLNNTFFERGAVESVVRPKTPRGDGNARNRPTWACPQRVVRPKTPRGDGNAPWMADALCAQVSSDPKPREGTETF
ncbi:Uncharacterised protein [Mycobacterium tuberculosis]|nr:Uncharacterised protein [Mycobacterium tuberculosis]